MASYPSSIVSLATHNDGDTIFSADINTPNAEIVAVETGLLNGFQHVLKPLTNVGFDLGTTSLAWKSLYLGGVTSGYLQLKAASIAGTNILTFPAATTDFSSTGGANQYVKQLSAGGALTVAAMLESEFPNFTTWTDFAGSSTVTGWASTTTKNIFYKRIGNTIYVSFNIQGTSNATTVSFTLPTASNGSFMQLNNPIAAEDNGAVTANTAIAQLAAGSATVSCFKDITGTAWTNTGTKIVTGQFFYMV